MKDKKVVFMGTPEFSLNVLESLIENCNVIGVVTQPDKEVGRKHVLTMSPVKELALKHNIKVLQPKKLKNEYQDIIDLNPDVIITCAYGQILPYELLSYPKYKTINVHASLLPKLRGGAPIQRAIMEGYKKTGVTIMRTEAGMDDGDMISSYEIEIKDDDTYETLSSKLSVIGKDLLIKTLPSIFDGTCKYIKQNEDEVTFAKIIKKEDEYLNFNDTTINIYNKIRGLSPEPCCYFNLDNERVKVYNAKIGNSKASSYGKIINISKEGLGISTIDGEIIITKLQFPGKKVMEFKDYLNGIKKEDLINKKIN